MRKAKANQVAQPEAAPKPRPARSEKELERMKVALARTRKRHVPVTCSKRWLTVGNVALCHVLGITGSQREPLQNERFHSYYECCMVKSAKLLRVNEKQGYRGMDNEQPGVRTRHAKI